MPAAVLHRTLQEYGTGSEVALALDKYSGKIIESYHNRLVIGLHVEVHPITEGQTYQFPAIARAEADEHTPGTERPGTNQPENEERTVTLDPYQLMSDEFEGEMDEFIRHFAARDKYAREHAQACARAVEGRMGRMVALGARESARGTGMDAFPAGVQVTADNAGAVTAAYPLSLAGSKELQDDLGEIGQTFDETNVPDEGRIVFLSPYLKRVLLQDRTLTSRDYTPINDLITRRMVECEGFLIEQSNLIPGANDTSNTDIPTAYRADYSKTIALVIGASDAVGQVTAKNGVRPIQPTWQDTRHAWYFGAKIWQGTKWLRPEACGEIVLQ